MATLDLTGLSEHPHLHLTIDSGERLSEALVQRVTNVCRKAERAGHALTVVLDVGSAGGGGAGSPDAGSVHLVSQWERALRRLERVDAPIVAVASGVCAGPALEAMLVADYRVAIGGATFSFAGEHGVWPTMAVYRLVGEIGGGRVRRLVSSDRELAGSEAVEWGFVDVAVERDDVSAVITSALKRLHQVSGEDLAVVRRLVLDARSMTFEDALGAHLAACERILRRERASAVPVTERA